MITISFCPLSNSLPKFAINVAVWLFKVILLLIGSPCNGLVLNSAVTSCRKSCRSICLPWSVNLATISNCSPARILFGRSIVSIRRSVNTITRLSGSILPSINHSPDIGLSMVIKSKCFSCIQLTEDSCVSCDWFFWSGWTSWVTSVSFSRNTKIVISLTLLSMVKRLSTSGTESRWVACSNKCRKTRSSSSALSTWRYQPSVASDNCLSSSWSASLDKAIVCIRKPFCFICGNNLLMIFCRDWSLDAFPWCKSTRPSDKRIILRFLLVSAVLTLAVAFCKACSISVNKPWEWISEDFCWTSCRHGSSAFFSGTSILT